MPRRDPAAARGGAPNGNGGAPVYAALDLGTNNCRLLVAEPRPGGFEVVDAFSRIVRLGEGVAASGVLSQAAIGRTLGTLRVCAAKMRRRGVTRTRAVATEACRRARNAEAFFGRVRRETGIRLETISTREEARLGLDSCLPLLGDGRPYALIFDIGGGSTEVSWIELDGRRPRQRGLLSLPLGVVGLAERYGGREVSPAAYEAMVAEVARALAPFEARHGLTALIDGGRLQMLGTSGTVTTLTGVHKRLARYDRRLVDGAHLCFETVAAVSREIAAMSYRERVAHPCIGRQRADLVVAGCAILEAICALWPVGRLRVADRGLREGILLSLMAEDRAARPRP